MARRRKTYFHYVDQDSLSGFPGNLCSRRSPWREAYRVITEARTRAPALNSRSTGSTRRRRSQKNGLEGLCPVRSVLSQGIRGRNEPPEPIRLGLQRFHEFRIPTTSSSMRKSSSVHLPISTSGKEMRWVCTPLGEKPQILPPKKPRPNTRNARDTGPSQTQGETLLASSLHEIAESVRMRAMIFVVSDMLEEPSDMDAVCTAGPQARSRALSLFDPGMDFTFDRPPASWIGRGWFIITEPTVIREEYLARLNEHVQELRQGCLNRKPGITSFARTVHWSKSSMISRPDGSAAKRHDLPSATCPFRAIASPCPHRHSLAEPTPAPNSAMGRDPLSFSSQKFVPRLQTKKMDHPSSSNAGVGRLGFYDRPSNDGGRFPCFFLNRKPGSTRACA